MAVLMRRQRGPGGREGCCFPEITVPPSGLLLLSPGGLPLPAPPSKWGSTKVGDCSEVHVCPPE